MCPSTLPGKFPGQCWQDRCPRRQRGEKGWRCSLHVDGSAAPEEDLLPCRVCSPGLPQLCSGPGHTGREGAFLPRYLARIQRNRQCGNQQSSPCDNKPTKSPALPAPSTAAQLPHPTAPGALTGTAQAPAAGADPLVSSSSSALGSVAFAHLGTSNRGIYTTWPPPSVHFP